MVTPVATPMAKLMPNSTPQNWVMRFQMSRPVITYTDSMIASIHDRPSVSGTNRKWYSAVTANCRRERVTTSASMGRSLWQVGSGVEHVPAQRFGAAVGTRLGGDEAIEQRQQQGDLGDDD